MLKHKVPTWATRAVQERGVPRRVGGLICRVRKRCCSTSNHSEKKQRRPLLRKLSSSDVVSISLVRPLLLSKNTSRIHRSSTVKDCELLLLMRSDSGTNANCEHLANGGTLCGERKKTRHDNCLRHGLGGLFGEVVGVNRVHVQKRLRPLHPEQGRRGRLRRNGP